MADVAQLGVRIEQAGASEVIAALNRVEAAVSKTEGSVLGMGAAMGAASAATSALIGALGNVAQGALGAIGGVGQFASQLEQAGIAFTTMLHSGEAAQAFLQDLQQFAAETPFEFKELVPAAQRIMAMGFSAQQVIPLLTDIGNAASGMGGNMTENVNRITLALGQMHTAGRLNAQDMLQLTSVGVPAWDILAKSIGKTVAETRAMSEAGQITGDQMIAVFHEWASTNIGGLMEAQSHTFAGAMSTIRDVTMQTANGALQPFFAILRNAVDQLATTLQSDAFQAWAANVGEVIGRMGPLFENVLARVETLGPALQQFVNDHVGDVVDTMYELGERVFAIFDQLPTVWERLASIIETVRDPLQAIWEGLSQVGDLTRAIELGAFERLGDLLGGLGASLQNTFLPALADTFHLLTGGEGDISSVGDAFSALGTAASALAGQMGEAWQSIQIAFVDAHNALQPVFTAIHAWLADTIPPALATLQAAWDGFWSHAGPLVQATWGVVGPALGSLVGLLGALEATWLRKLADTWNSVWDGIRSKIEQFLPILQAVGSAVGGFAADLADKLTLALQQAAPPVVAQAQELGEQTRNAIVQGTAPIAAEVEQNVAPAAASIKQAGTTATGAATAFAGMGTAATGASDAAKKLADETKKAAEAIELATLKGEGAFVADAQLAETTKQLGALAQGLGPATEGWVKYKIAVGEAADALKYSNGLATQQIARLEGQALAAAEYTQRVKGLTDQERAHYDAVRQVLGAEEALRQLREAQSAAPTGQSSAASRFGVGAALGAGAYDIGVAIANGFRNNVGSGPEHFGAEIGAGFNGAVHDLLQSTLGRASQAAGGAASGGGEFFKTLLGSQYITGQGGGLGAAAGVGNMGAGGGLFSLLDAESQQRYQRVLQQQYTDLGHDYIMSEAEQIATALRLLQMQQERVGAANLQAAASAKNYGPTGQVGQFFNPETGALEWKYWLQSVDGGIVANKAQEAALKALQGATVEQANATDRAAKAAQGATATFTAGTGAAQRSITLYATLDEALMGNAQAVAQRAAQATQEWAIVAANAKALQAGQMVNAFGTTPTGLTHTQIYGGPAPTTGGSSLGPGSYYGLPVVSPLTPGTLIGHAGGGLVSEPSYLVSMRSGRAWGSIAEQGPERVVPGGGGGVTINVYPGLGAEALVSEAAYWDRVYREQLGPISQKYGYG